MATFDEVRKFVYDRYAMESDDPMDLCFKVSLPKGRSQNISIHKVSVPQGHEYLRMISFIAPSDKVDPVSCLRFNASFPGGHLALDYLNGKEMLVMCCTQILEVIALDGLEASIQRVASAADALERKLFAKDDF